MAMNMQQLAELTGTSMATVSRVLSNKPGVAQKTREKVLRMAEELGYQPNRNAQNLARSKSQVLGYIAAELQNPGHLDFLRMVQAFSKEAGYQVLVMDSARELEREKDNVDIMLQHRVDGLLMFPVSDWIPATHLDHLLKLKLKHFPFVIVGRLEGYPFDFACSEEINSARKLAKHLIELGHTRFAFIGYDQHNRCVRDRVNGVYRALNEAGLTAPGGGHVAGLVKLVATDPDQRWKHEVVSMLDQPDGPTAIIAGDLARALELYRPIKNTGRKIPDDVSIVGFDDEYWTVEVQPSLTVSTVDNAEVARAAFDILMKRMDNPELSPMVEYVPQTLIVRESSGPVPEDVHAATHGSHSH